MVAIVKRLVSLFLLAVATSLSVEPTCAMLTTFPAAYDGLAMSLLMILGEFRDVTTALANPKISLQFNLFEKRIQSSADAGSLTVAEFVQLRTTFFTEANKAMAAFPGVKPKSLTAGRIETEEHMRLAPAYWGDFLFGAWGSVATSMNNPVLIADVQATIAQLEVDIKNRAKPQLVLDKITAFYAIRPAFANAVGVTYKSVLYKIQVDLAAAGGEPAPPLPPPPPPPQPVVTTATATPTTPTIAPPPMAAKSNATATTAPASAPIKSSAIAVGVVSTLPVVVAMTFVATTVV